MSALTALSPKVSLSVSAKKVMRSVASVSAVEPLQLLSTARSAQSSTAPGFTALEASLQSVLSMTKLAGATQLSEVTALSPKLSLSVSAKKVTRSVASVSAVEPSQLLSTARSAQSSMALG